MTDKSESKIAETFHLDQQLREKSQILLSSTENDDISQVVKEAGLSRSLVLSWQKGAANLPSDGSILELSNIHAGGQEMDQQFSNAKKQKHKSQISYLRLPETGQEKMEDAVQLHRVASSIFRWWWLIILMTVIAATAGYMISQTLQPVYEAKSSLIVGQSIQATSLDSRDIQTSERLALSYADIARRQPILEATNESLNLNYSWLTLRNRVRVKPVPDTQLLEIFVEAGSREEAIAIADEIARQLILLSPTSSQYQNSESSSNFVQTRLADLQSTIEANQERINKLSSELAAAATSERKAEIQAEINNLEKLNIDWDDNYTKFLTYAGSNDSSNYLEVVEKGHAKRTPIRPAIRLNTVIAGIVGLAVALGIIFLLEFLNDTLETVDDIVQRLYLTPLGTVQHYSRRDSQEKAIVLQNPFSPVSESYRMIRNNIQFMSIDQPGKSLLVTSPAPKDGKSSVAVNLGIAMANNGYRTTIVDTDLRKPVLHKVFQVPREMGLTDFLRDFDKDADLPLHITNIERLQLITAGKQPPNPSELLGSQRMVDFMERLMQETDIVIYDSPPAAFVSDAAVLSTRVDGVVFVVSAGKTRRDLARRALFNLQQAGSHILGVVLNRAANNGGRYGYYSPTEEIEHEGNRAYVLLQNVWKNVTFYLN
ncbi:MAG: polysaccharide biosynthesis tyrosine autokinase [Candidatus Promineifilaceae bacterium]|nr:polysaccharide biosynthesis tyrosine autokinase [Candidatus Promineifilaceae bacterium]